MSRPIGRHVVTHGGRVGLVLALLLTSTLPASRIFAQTPAAPEATDLYRLSVHEAPTGNGRPLEMSARELERAADHSLIEFTIASGGSVATPMFELRAMCAVMRARGKRYFVSKEVSDPPVRYRVEFPDAPGEADLAGPKKRAFSIVECDAVGF